MKKFSSLAIALVMVLALASCGDSAGKSFDEMTAYEHYLAVSENQKSAKSVEMELNAVIGMSMPALGMNMDMNMSGNVKQVMYAKADVDMETDLTMSIMGQSTTVKMYYVNGIMFQDDGTNKTKRPTPMSELYGGAGMINSISTLEFSQEDILDSRVEDVEGGKKVYLVPDPEKLNDILGELIGPAMSSVGAEDMDMDVDITSLEYEMEFDREHNLKDMRLVMTMDMAMNVEGMQINMGVTMDMAYKIIGINSVDAILLPPDVSSYVLAETA